MSAEKSLDVLAIGEAMVEFNQQPAAAAGPAVYLAGFGGDTSNCAVAAARMGARSGYLTQVGDETFGDDLLALWQREGVDTRGVSRMVGAQTGLYFVTHGNQGHRFTYRRAGSAASCMGPQSIPPGLVEGARWLHCSGISQAISASACDAVFEAINRARVAGTLVSYDLNFRPSLWPAARALQMAKATLAHSDLFFPSVDEIGALTGLVRSEDILRWSHDQGAKTVALKLGAAGCMVSDVSGARLVEPWPVQALDATGAGDCFAGALLARLSAGDDLDRAARAANVAAALSTLGYGAVNPLPSWVDVVGKLG